VDRDGGPLPDPTEFTAAAGQTASARVTSIVTAHVAGQIISVITVQGVDQPAAVAVAWPSCPMRSHRARNEARSRISENAAVPADPPDGNYP
jgi:hypothetical protein